MSNEINPHLDASSADTISSIIDNKNFLSLDPNMQNKVIDTVHNDREKDGGVMGKFLGTKTSNVAMHICLIICILLFVLLLVDFVHSYITEQSINMELVKTFMPIITASLGYLFGKGSH